MHKTDIGNIYVSDHALIYMEIVIRENSRAPWQWKLNSHLIRDPRLLEGIKRELADFFSEK